MPPVALQELELQSSLFKEAALQLPGVVSRLESLQTAVHQQQQQHAAVASQAEVEGLRAQLKAMQRTVTSLTEELHSQAAGKAGEGPVDCARCCLQPGVLWLRQATCCLLMACCTRQHCSMILLPSLCSAVVDYSILSM